MTIELRPFGVTCNIACQYCYQNPIRDAGNFIPTYNIPAMKAAIEKEGGPFALFGGEPLLLPLDDLEEILAWGLEKYGRNTVQTNGALITKAHIRLFKQYRVNVGISIDGPGPLNDVRWAGSLAKTRGATIKTEKAIDALCDAGIPVSLIVTLHRHNAEAAKLPHMQTWLRQMAAQGVRRARLHLLEVENPLIRDKYALDPHENMAALLAFAELEAELPRDFLDVFHDIKKMIQGQDTKAACVWRACDPYTTAAVRGVEGNGQRTNCGRTNKDGIDFVKGQRQGFERYIALYHTPQNHNGCQGCRFFLMCKGQCPGTAVDGDWRNRTEHCQTWIHLFTHFEEAMLARDEVPLSQHPLRPQLEAVMLREWAQGRNHTVEHLITHLEAA